MIQRFNNPAPWLDGEILQMTVGDRFNDVSTNHANYEVRGGISRLMFLGKAEGKALDGWIGHHFDSDAFGSVEALLEDPHDPLGQQIRSKLEGPFEMDASRPGRVFNNFALVPVKPRVLDIEWLCIHPMVREGTVDYMLSHTEDYFNRHGLFADKATRYSVRNAAQVVHDVMAARKLEVYQVGRIRHFDKCTDFLGFSRNARPYPDDITAVVQTYSVQGVPFLEITGQQYARIVPALRKMALDNADLLSLTASDMDRLAADVRRETANVRELARKGYTIGM